jgi:hypothetical protein
MGKMLWFEQDAGVRKNQVRATTLWQTVCASVTKAAATAARLAPSLSWVYCLGCPFFVGYIVGDAPLFVGYIVCQPVPRAPLWYGVDWLANKMHQES